MLWINTPLFLTLTLSLFVSMSSASPAVARSLREFQLLIHDVIVDHLISDSVTCSENGWKGETFIRGSIPRNTWEHPRKWFYFHN
jgi:hypothetical protein